MNATTKTTVKPVRGYSGHKVFRDGVEVATIHFGRNRDSQGRVFCGGRIDTVDGRTIDLAGYCYFRDVVRDIDRLIGEPPSGRPLIEIL